MIQNHKIGFYHILYPLNCFVIEFTKLCSLNTIERVLGFDLLNFCGSHERTRYSVVQSLQHLKMAGQKEKICVEKLKNKHKLVFEFHASKGLVRLHIDSFNHFIETEIKKIVEANKRVSVPSANWWLEYNDIYIKPPTVNDGSIVGSRVTPHDCRLRDLTYAGEILVDITFTRQNEIVSKKGVLIGKMPLMLKCSACVLHGIFFE